MVQGKVWGPYLPPEKFKIDRVNGEVLLSRLLDYEGNPILYYPAHQPATGPPLLLQNSWQNQSRSALYDIRDNDPTLFGRPSDASPSTDQVSRWRATFGDIMDPTGSRPGDGLITAGKENDPSIATGFVLWCAGRDGNFGPDPLNASASDVQRCDDVTTFR